MTAKSDFLDAIAAMRIGYDQFSSDYLSFIEDGKTFLQLQTSVTDNVVDVYIDTMEKCDAWQSDADYTGRSTDLKLYLNDKLFGAFETMYAQMRAFVERVDFLETWGSGWETKNLSDMGLPIRNGFKKLVQSVLRRYGAMVRRLERASGRIHA